MGRWAVRRGGVRGEVTHTPEHFRGVSSLTAHHVCFDGPEHRFSVWRSA